MRVLMLHNFYRASGGEDTCFFAERDMLRAAGHEVHTITRHNDDTATMSPGALALATVWNAHSHARVKQAIRRFRPDVMHCHNIFPLLSPAVYHAARGEGVAVVQTLHNYRLLCLNAMLFRDGHVCTECVGRAVPWPGIAARCYHGSLQHSASVASLLAIHRMLRTWRRCVDLFLAVSAFARDRHVEAGFDADRIAIKPNVIATDPGCGNGDGGYVLMASRLGAEKGLQTALAAWRAHPGNPMLLIAGDGPLRRLEAEMQGVPNVRFLGRRAPPEIHALMQRAMCVVAPSEWYETFGMSILEAFACGTPVIASRIGAYRELVQEGETGFLFEAGSSEQLQAALDRLLSRPEPGVMRRAARGRFEAGFSPTRNCEMLVRAYEAARANRASRHGIAQRDALA
jgi:glycosyltransferase involved in cell wall biosynthesis